jgi:hypothetical protein
MILSLFFASTIFSCLKGITPESRRIRLVSRMEGGGDEIFNNAFLHI